MPTKKLRVWFHAPRQVVLDGYGHSTGDLRAALEKHDWIELVDSYKDPHDFIFIYSCPDYVGHARRRSDKPIGMYTMWETTKPPIQWIDDMQECVFVANPTKWGARAFEAQYNLPKVHYVPLAINHDYFYPVERQHAGQPYTFLSYNSGFGALRKGFTELVQAFQYAFQPDDDVRLLIKSARPDLFNDVAQAEWIKMLENGEPDNPYTNIVYIADACTRDDLRELYLKEADCFVFPSKGEGFGHTPLEAMATGLPCIISSGHGMSEYFNPSLHYDFATHDEPAEFDRKGNFGKWPAPDIQSLGDRMRYAYENQEESADRGKRSIGWSRKWRYDTTAQYIADLIEQHT